MQFQAGRAIKLTPRAEVARPTLNPLMRSRQLQKRPFWMAHVLEAGFSRFVRRSF
jgi:hypothetical protein